MKTEMASAVMKATSEILSAQLKSHQELITQNIKHTLDLQKRETFQTYLSQVAKVHSDILSLSMTANANLSSSSRILHDIILDDPDIPEESKKRLLKAINELFSDWSEKMSHAFNDLLSDRIPKDGE